MKKQSLRSLLATFTLLGVIGSTDVAMAKPSHGQPGKRIAMLKERLNLSDEQANKIGEILAEGRGECRSRTEGTERRNCWKNRAQSKREQIATVLSPEQRAQFAELRAEHRERKLARREKCGR